MEEFKKSELNEVKRGINRALYDVDKINAILDAGFICFVGYNYNGKVISLPMSYGRIGNKIYLHGSGKNRMLLNLLECKDVSITVMHLDGLVLARSGLHHSVNYRSATLFGKLVEVENLKEKEAILKCVVDQMINGRWEELRPITNLELKRTLVVEMTIETASAKIRNEGAIDEKRDRHLPIWAGVIPIKQVSEYPLRDHLLPEDIKMPDHVLEYYNTHKSNS
ncbi:pyridoxamine 5'-phosphate oxidase family protein [uncultured Algibacter sp.]|uniref:pyridoxamine 5'-phosphate oxidase family protein n=1 Tax=uncultured Algibacter sp. TaxID=298659 RepID=UPI002610E227|nr:pyridoxamine 5'-phosphate oxidase family protein [uncultured Algibacter sp.]